jgi:hypothetical protein
MLTAIVLSLIGIARPAGQAEWLVYGDAQGRFSFSYPASFGTPEPGTDSGFGNRVAAIRFSGLSGLGGEAVLTSGPVDVDVQALGGLYDAITLQLLPLADRASVRAAVPAATASNFCRLLGQRDHLGNATNLPAATLEVARRLDGMRNLDPGVVSCVASGSAIAFHKTATYQAGRISARQHLFGAIRFLPGPYSSFQIVRASTSPPETGVIEILAQLVSSFRTPSAPPGSTVSGSTHRLRGAARRFAR